MDIGLHQEYSSKNTSINKNKLPVIFSKVDFTDSKLNLDYGGGKYDIATEYLESKYNTLNLIYDPFNRTEEHNKYVRSFSGEFDTCTLSNVLNVIKESEVRKFILDDIHSMLKDNGILYITIYPGNKSGQGKVSKKGCWQENRTIDKYLDEVKKVFPNTYIKNGVIIASK